jgi:hypothetical protein
METTMSEYVTDPALLAQLNDEQGYVSDPALLAQLNASETVLPPGTLGNEIPEPSAVPQLPVSGYGPGVVDVAKSAAMATPMGQNVGKVMQPYAAGANKLMGQYVNNPLTKLAPDLLATASGVPPPFATAQVIGSTQGAYNVARNLPATPSVGPVDPMAQKLAQSEFSQEIARRAAAAQAETVANRSMIQKIAMSKIMQTAGQVAGPALNTAARVAGPAGLAYNMYEAGNMARDTQLGERLGAGQGGSAEQAFRNINTQYGDAFRNTVTAQQARDILASGSTRDIAAFGGAAFLRQRAGQ